MKSPTMLRVSAGGRRAFFTRVIARSYLEQAARAHAGHYPQVASFSFDHITSRIALDGRYDRSILELLLPIVKEIAQDKIVLDVGANIGNHALAFASVAQRVIALEPHPKLFRLLSLNTEDTSNILALPIGASDEAAQLRAVTPPGNWGGTSITDDSATPAGTEVIFQVQPIDAIEQVSGEDVGVIKVDVEGHELQALKGAREMIARCEPLIILEQLFDPDVAKREGSVTFLRSLGYSHFYSVEEGLEWKVPQSLPRLLRKLLRGIEIALVGPPATIYALLPVTELGQRDYPTLLASVNSL